MFPINSILEKSLLPVNGKPVIRHIVDNLVNSGTVRELTITCLDKFRKNFEHEFRDVSIPTRIHSVHNPLGTFGTFLDTYNSFSGYERAYKLSEYIMVHYADCFTKINYQDFVSQIDKKVDGIIAVTNKVKHDYSEVMLGRRSKAVLKFNEKPTISNYTWSGIGIFNGRNLVTKYEKSFDTDFAFDIFPQMIEKNKLNAYQYHGEWFDMGNLNSYRKVCSMFNGEK